MRQSLRLRPPGVYHDATEKRVAPLALARSGVPGFVGLTRKGPTNIPVHITSVERFREIYGRLDSDTYLAPAIEGFFANGGRECFVLRVARQAGHGAGEFALPASTRVRDQQGKHTIQIEALNEGSWGNGITVSVRPQPPKVQTFITLDMHAGDNGVAIRSTHGFSRGTVVRVYDDTHEFYRVVHEVDGKNLFWSQEEPAEHGFRSGGPTYVEPVAFEVEVQGEGLRESFKDLSFARMSPNYFERAVNGASQLILLRNLGSDSILQQRYPSELKDVALTGGADGLFNVTPADFIGRDDGPGHRLGLRALEVVEQVDLLVIPDLMWALEHSTGFNGTTKNVEVVQDEMISQCERTRDRFSILDVPDPRDHLRALNWRLQFDSAYAALYFPWIVVEHEGRQRLVPPSGHIAGAYARTDADGGLHHAPANVSLEGVLDLERVLQDPDIGYLNGRGVNCLKYFPTRGVRVWGARTVSSDPNLRFVNVRRVLNGIIRAVTTNLQWVVFEPNHPRLWKSVMRNVSFFLRDLWRLGYFKGRVPEEAFYVKCDHETNPPELRDAGYLVVEVGVSPVRPAEFIVFRVQQAVEEVGPGAGAESVQE